MDSLDSLRPLQSEIPAVGDQELARRAGAGDHAAFAAIMRRHNRALYRASRSVLGNDADAEDAVQEAYISAYQALPAFRSESSLRTWLTRITLNHAFERLRKRKRFATTTDIDNVIAIESHLDPIYMRGTAQTTPERTAMGSEARMLLERRIDALPAVFRVVFVMRAIEEMSVEETAACLGIPEATVRTRYFRARRQLRLALSADVKGALLESFAFGGERCDRIVRAVLARIRCG